MAIEVRVTSVLQRVVGGKTVQSEGNTIAEVLEQINAQHPGFREQITMEDGSLHRFVNIYVNGEDVRFLDNVNTRLTEKDEVSIVPAVAGG